MIARHPGNCKPHPQDKWYGEGFRVMTVSEKDRKILGARCTVCGPPKTKNVKRGGVYAISDLTIRSSYGL